MTVATPSSSHVGVRPRRVQRRSYSSSVSPCSRAVWSVTSGRCVAASIAWSTSPGPCAASAQGPGGSALARLRHPICDRLEDLQAVRAAARELARPELAVRRVLGVRHEPEYVSRRIHDAGDVAQGAVRVVVRGGDVAVAVARAVGAAVAQEDRAVALELVEGVGVGDVAALAVLDRNAPDVARDGELR